MSKALREGEAYDQDLFNRFMMQHAKLINAIEPIIRSAFASSTLIEAADGEDISPNSGRYRYSSRPKVFRTTVEKIKRMKSTPIYRIQDIAGLRVDFDGTHAIQDGLAELLEEALMSAGATRVKQLDLRTTPHSGYRALHLSVDFPAGKAEIQLRTALQAQWANLYEVAADIYGRQIRYEDWDAELSDEQRRAIASLHELSDGIYQFEMLRQSIQGRHRKGSKPGKLATPVRRINATANELYGKIEEMVDMFRRVRDSAEPQTPKTKRLER